MSSDIAIKVENLSKCYHIYDNPRDRLAQMFFWGRKKFYREFWALKDVSFEIKRGETVGIVGRNGSGKSTLLQMICGTLNATQGTIQVGGRIAALLELGSGFNPEFTGRENVYMNAAILGLRPDEVDKRYEEILAFSEIGEFIHQPVKTYSSGMLVRLAFAVAINVAPQILIVDEALSVGDEAFQRKCFAKIEQIKENGATILFCSHSGSTIVSLCDQALLLDSGELLMIDHPKKVVTLYQKFIFAPAEERFAIRESFRKGTVLEANIESRRDELGPADDHASELYDPNLKPSSTVEYVSRGPRIVSPAIYTIEGKLVNCLLRGRRYRYCYRVKFDQAAFRVRFGMLIKTVSGLELGGAQSSPDSQGIDFVDVGTTAIVEFLFDCNLNPGSYFLNAGVVGRDRDEETFLHRIIDAVMFKVLPTPQDTSTALIDFNGKARITMKKP
jgi:lipopolysaccharide transport system ATP-binding protein